MTRPCESPTNGIEPIRPGLWSIKVPIPNNPLGYTLVYVFGSDRGPVLVDTGWQHPDSWDALVRGLSACGYAVEDVYGVLSTHHHNDHHGLAGQVRNESGAWIAMHEADAKAIRRRGMSDDEWYQETIGLLVEAGASEEDIQALPTPGDVGRTRVVSPDRLLSDGERADVPGWHVEAIWTPGHTPGHLCFAEHRHQLLLAGDHLLPDLSPHIGLLRVEAVGDPLGDYLASLGKVSGRGFREVLPAHQHRFDDADGRISTLIEHHDERLQEVIRIVREVGAVTAWDLAERMTWSRHWSTFGIMTRRTAVAEALAHVRLLERRDTLVRADAVQPTWELGPGPESSRRVVS